MLTLRIRWLLSEIGEFRGVFVTNRKLGEFLEDSFEKLRGYMILLIFFFFMLSSKQTETVGYCKFRAGLYVRPKIDRRIIGIKKNSTWWFVVPVWA